MYIYPVSSSSVIVAVEYYLFSFREKYKVRTSLKRKLHSFQKKNLVLNGWKKMFG